MPNIVSALKEEITRLARKEIRKEFAPLREAASRARHDIANLKRTVSEQERTISTLAKQCGGKHAKVILTKPEDAKGLKYSAKGLRSLRKKLGLSATDFGQLIGVSSLTIYNWESEKARPRARQLAALASVRGMGKREAIARLAEIKGVDPQELKGTGKKTTRKKATAKKPAAKKQTAKKTATKKRAPRKTAAAQKASPRKRAPRKAAAPKVEAAPEQQTT